MILLVSKIWIKWSNSLLFDSIRFPTARWQLIPNLLPPELNMNTRITLVYWLLIHLFRTVFFLNPFLFVTGSAKWDSTVQEPSGSADATNGSPVEKLSPWRCLACHTCQWPHFAALLRPQHRVISTTFIIITSRQLFYYSTFFFQFFFKLIKFFFLIFFYQF